MGALNLVFLFGITVVVCGTLLVALFLILLSLPKSQLSTFLLRVVGISFAVACGLYVVSPIDFIPDAIPVVGWMDDAAVAVAGITGAIAALRAND